MTASMLEGSRVQPWAYMAVHCLAAGQGRAGQGRAGHVYDWRLGA